MMKATLLALATPALAQLNIPALIAGLGPAPASDPRFTHPVPPGPGDVRSPCPGLNTLANHGFLNHNGKNMTIPGLLTGLAAGLNIGPDFSVLVGALGLLASPNPLGGSFNLDDLDQHNFPIEHDASLSRQDAYFGNDYSYNQTQFNQALSYYKGQTETSIVTSTEARYARIQSSNQTNPQFTYGLREFVFSYGETGLYTQTMSSPLSNGVARVDFIKSLFENETLPFALGWRPSTVPITFATLGQMIVEMNTAVPSEELPLAETVTASSYREILEFEVGGSEVLANLTQGISSYLGF